MTVGFAKLVVLILSLTAPGSTCGVTGLEGELLGELNAARRAAGFDAVAPHPVLCDLARVEASEVAATGGTPTEAGHINSMTSRLYRSDYAPHGWTEGSLVTTSDEAVLSQWRSVRPAWVQDAVTGDFEHVGIGLDRYGDRLVVTLVLAITARTVELRRAEPLKDLRSVRAQALAEVNRQRALAGRSPLIEDAALNQAAQAHAEDLVRRNYYDHRSPDGTTPRDRVRAAGYRGGGGFAENIAKGPFHAGRGDPALDEQLRTSPEHPQSPGHQDGVRSRVRRQSCG